MNRAQKEQARHMDIEGFTQTKGLGFKLAEDITLYLKDKGRIQTSKVAYWEDTKLCAIKTHSFLGSTPDFRLLAGTKGKECLLYAKGNKARTSFEWKVTPGAETKGLRCATIKAKRASFYEPLAYNVQVELLEEDFKDSITHVDGVSWTTQTLSLRRKGKRVATLTLKKCSSFTGRRTYELLAKQGEHLGLVLLVCAVLDWLRGVSAAASSGTSGSSRASSYSGTSHGDYSFACLYSSSFSSCGDGGGGGDCGC
ncbi:hypothetical protein QOT17_003360 [Balamuthia mandrillaris]